jgi:hypothetical protein
MKELNSVEMKDHAMESNSVQTMALCLGSDSNLAVTKDHDFLRASNWASKKAQDFLRASNWALKMVEDFLRASNSASKKA